MLFAPELVPPIMLGRQAPNKPCTGHAAFFFFLVTNVIFDTKSAEQEWHADEAKKDIDSVLDLLTS